MDIRARVFRIVVTFLGSALLVAAASTAHAGWTRNGAPITKPARDQTAPSFAADGAGGILSAWVDARDSTSGALGLYAQRLDSDGDPASGWPVDGLLLTANIAVDEGPRCASDGNGGMFVVWADTRSSPVSSLDIYAQHLMASGERAPGWLNSGLPVCRAVRRQSRIAAAPDGSGGLLVAWNDARARETFSGLAAEGGIYAVRLDASGAVVTGWIADGVAATLDTTAAGFPQIAADGVGGAYLAWSDVRPGELPEIRVQHLTGSGAALWGPYGMDVSLTPGFSRAPSIATEDGGGMLVAWNEGGMAGGYADEDVYGQRLTSAGALYPGWPVGGIAVSAAVDGQLQPKIAPDGLGGMIVAWRDLRVDGTNFDLYAQHLSADGSVFPGWTSDGNAFAAAPGYQNVTALVGDGAGGVVMAWDDRRDAATTQSDVYALRVTAGGTVAAGWPAAGLPVCVLAGEQSPLAIVPSTSGGFITAWLDSRNGDFNLDLYAARVGAGGTVPALLSLARAEATQGEARLEWFTTERDLAATLERSSAEGDWQTRAVLRPDGLGMLRYADRDVIPGRRYGYRLRFLDSGSPGLSEETWLDIPDVTLTIERASWEGNALQVSLHLPATGPATLELFDLVGRRMRSRLVDGPAPGDHVVQLTGRPLPAATYWLELTQAGRRVARRVPLVR